MAKVRWTEQAIEDVNNIAEFIAKDSVKYASIQVKRFFESTDILKKQIRSGKVVPEIQDSSIRELVQGNYRIIYRIVTETYIDIITVHHSRRLLENNPFLNEGTEEE